MKTLWTTKWPTKVGDYWAYWYRYGKISCGTPCEPEMTLMRVMKISNGMLYTADGQFVFESEVEEPYFMKAELPAPPDIKEIAS